MKKRLSKSEYKRLRKKEKLKKLRKINYNLNQGDYTPFCLSFPKISKVPYLIPSLVISSLALFFTFCLTAYIISKIENVPIKAVLKTKATNEALAEEEKNSDLTNFRKQIDEIVAGTPMTKMTERISQKDRTTAAFLVGIALKESKFGIYSPKKDGRDCYNYWGYRGKENPTASGYSCFDNPEQAVDIVGKRLANLVAQGRNTPKQMVVWKCGYSCDGHSDASVKSWINDVSINFYKLNQNKEIAKNKK